MLLQQIANAVVLGSVYAALAVGFNLFFGTLRVVNFAHGEVYMLGAFAGLAVATGSLALHLGPYVTLVAVIMAAALGGGLAGVAIERIAFRTLRRPSSLVLLLSSLAVSLTIRVTMMVALPDGANPRSFPALFGNVGYDLGWVIITPEALCSLLFLGAAFLLTYLIVYRTTYGRSLRAVAEDSEAAVMAGINANRVITLSFFLGSALGGATGVLSGLLYGSVAYDMGIWAGLKGFTAAVIGGLGHIKGALWGGLCLASLETFITGYIPSGSKYSDVLVFMVLVVVLTVRANKDDLRGADAV